MRVIYYIRLGYSLTIHYATFSPSRSSPSPPPSLPTILPATGEQQQQ